MPFTMDLYFFLYLSITPGVMHLLDFKHGSNFITLRVAPGLIKHVHFTM